MAAVTTQLHSITRAIWNNSVH
uniref:Uncharacterized protein n=1 Tax=Anguilla anguilla TaxID=7936 RepID=A0A0E9PDR0_ANGAN